MEFLVAGNWKMNGMSAALDTAREIAEGANAHAARVSVMICPPATLVAAMATATADTALLIGGQDCHAAASGAHTGDLSAEMLADSGANAVIVGHSERRTDHGETDSIVRAKAIAAHRADMTAIICVGETGAERDQGRAMAVVEGQLNGSVPELPETMETADAIVIAYEPVWAIGTGRTPSADDISAMHSHIRQWLVNTLGDEGGSVRILYGGSMKPGNAAEILALESVDGGLVGGASLDAGDFLEIVRAAANAEQNASNR